MARNCAEEGADIVIAQGSHAPLRPIEIYDNCTIIYDPGDFMGMSSSVTKLPSDFYERFSHNIQTTIETATPSDALDARADKYGDARNPDGGYYSTPVSGNLIVVCNFDSDSTPRTVELHPGTLLEEPAAHAGVPTRVDGEHAAEIIEYVSTISKPYDTTIKKDGDKGIIEL
jgi:poly-gamma-glutamate synthesis protein (capsule biosynthesis protein)